MQKYKTFAEVKKNFKVEKNWHMPWHFNQSGQYVCFLEGGLECFKTFTFKGEGEYVVQKRR